MQVLQRIAGAVVGGGGTYLALRVAAPAALTEPVRWGLAGVMAVAGCYFGARVWEAVVQIF
jgi:hypothetical protein